MKSCLDLSMRRPLGDAQGVRDSIERFLRILDGTCTTDLFQPCRLDPDVPVEETVGAIAEYVRASKIRAVDLGEVSAASIRKAQAIVPIAAVKIELSLFETGVLNNGVAETYRELSIPLVALSPISHDFLSSQIRSWRMRRNVIRGGSSRGIRKSISGRI